eukprot:CAMPEP_0177630772 /NCGR_PEP_ID=MMETSP0447-20121125/1388_1 /TAXON_ID=0 /ORGANISM="Stygamoeba regulata, Strain BSH-02190019" /LENGTH=506 /DNA_ID=CAMNT_0019132199 /DNA_START=46 /DNA_END=1563 /DNA_ORIENTATION=-
MGAKGSREKREEKKLIGLALGEAETFDQDSDEETLIDPSGALPTPDYLVQSLTMCVQVSDLKRVKQCLRSQPDVNWLTDFVDFGGIESILEIVEIALARGQADGKLEKEAVFCLAAFIDQEDGLDMLVKNDVIVERITLLLNAENPPFIVMILKALSIMAVYSRTGYDVVNAGFDGFKRRKHDRYKFARLMQLLRGDYHLVVKYETLCLINILVNSPEDIIERIDTREVLLKQGVTSVFDRLSYEYCEDLQVQVNMFLNQMSEDKNDMRVGRVKLSDPVDIIKNIYRLLQGTPSYTTFLSTMQLLLLVPGNEEASFRAWTKIEASVQEAVSMAGDVDLDTIRTVIQDNKSMQGEENVVKKGFHGLMGKLTNSDKASRSSDNLKALRTESRKGMKGAQRHPGKEDVKKAAPPKLTRSNSSGALSRPIHRKGSEAPSQMDLPAPTTIDVSAVSKHQVVHVGAKQELFPPPPAPAFILVNKPEVINFPPPPLSVLPGAMNLPPTPSAPT